MTSRSSKDLIASVADAGRQTAGGLDRRSFLKLSGVIGGGLVLASVAPSALGEDEAPVMSSAELNAFIQIRRDGKVLIYSANAEMGQGVKTTLPMIVAEELGVRWQDVEVVQSPVDERFGRQFAGGSMTTNLNWDKLRTAGASAREMLITAGSIVMEVSREELIAAESRVTHTPTGNYRTYGELANLAARQEVPDPDTLEFRERQDYRILGRSISGVDNLVLTTGLALFGIDTKVPDMLYAAFEKCPAFGGRYVSANLDEIRKLPGVVDAFPIEGFRNTESFSPELRRAGTLVDGVAIVGQNTWAVFNAKRRLKVEWDEREASKDSWTQLVKDARALEGTRGASTTIDKGDVDGVLADPDNRVLEAFYEYPYVAHNALEPINCTAHYQHGANDAPDRLELWLPAQIPGRALLVTPLFDLEDEQVTIHQMRLGGSFGRRVTGEYICEATAISRHVRAPVKLTYTREDDIRHDFYRVGGFQSLRAAVNDEGQLVAFENHHIGIRTHGRPATGSSFRATEFPVENLANARVTETRFDMDTPPGPWRAPGSNTNAFAVQCFLDEVAHAADRDFRDFLIEIMGEPRWFEDGNIRSLNTGRAVGVIKLAAEKAGWGRSMPEGRGLGLAFYFSHAAHVAEVADVSVDADNNVKVHNVTVAVDIGPVLNWSGATSQVEGAVIDGLSAMAGQKITMEQGRIQQSNLHDYAVLRMPSAPPVDIHFIESDFAPTGIGEPALPPLAPAVGNAIFAATGQRVRKMPLSDEGFTV